MSACYDYVKDNGILPASQYPYVGRDGTCKQKKGTYFISGYKNVTQNYNSLLEAVAKQPLSVGVDATSWQFYTSGVMTNCKVG